MIDVAINVFVFRAISSCNPNVYKWHKTFPCCFYFVACNFTLSQCIFICTSQMYESKTVIKSNFFLSSPYFIDMYQFYREILSDLNMMLLPIVRRKTVMLEVGIYYSVKYNVMTADAKRLTYFSHLCTTLFSGLVGNGMHWPCNIVIYKTKILCHVTSFSTTTFFLSNTIRRLKIIFYMQYSKRNFA